MHIHAYANTYITSRRAKSVDDASKEIQDASIIKGYAPN